MNVGCAGKIVRSLENACYIPERLIRGHYEDGLHNSTFTFTSPYHRVYGKNAVDCLLPGLFPPSKLDL